MDLSTFLDIGLPRLLYLFCSISIIVIALSVCSKKPKQASKSPNPKIHPFPTTPTSPSNSDNKKSEEKVAESPGVKASPAVKSKEKSQKSKKKVKSVKKAKSVKKVKEKSDKKKKGSKESGKKKKEERSKDKKKKRNEKSGDLPIMTTQPSTPASMEESDSIGTAQIELIQHTPSKASKERMMIREKTTTSKENDKKPKRGNDKHEKSPSTGGTTGIKTAAELRTGTGTSTAAEIKSTF